jgi:hypothetical protein
MHTPLDPPYAAHLYPWSETAGFISIVLHLMTEEEPIGKMLCVYNNNNNNNNKTETILEVKCMCVLNNTLSSLSFGLTEYVVFILL